VRIGTAVIGLGGIVTGGIVLGSALGSMVDPVPRNLSPGVAVETADILFEPASSYQFVEAGPAELALPVAPDGYAPAWASDGQAWTYPEPDYSPWVPEPFPTLAELDARIEAERAAAELAAAEQIAPSEIAPAEIGPPLPADPPLRESRLTALY